MEKSKGSLTVGKDADIVLPDDKYNVILTLVEGNIVSRSRHMEENLIQWE